MSPATGRAAPTDDTRLGEPRRNVVDRATLMAAGRALEAKGKLLEAIDVYSAANRLRRNIKLEQRLVRLRHEAFALLPTDAGRPDWPPVYPDLFPDVTGRPPEITPAELDEQTLGAGITHHGSLLVRGLLGPDVIESLTEAIDRAFDACRAHLDGASVEETLPWFAPFKALPEWKIGYGRMWVVDGGGVWTVDSPRATFEIMEAFESAGVREALSGYLGERPAISVKKWTLRRVPVDSGSDWHQDGAFLGDGIRTVNVWVSLTDCGGEDGSAPGLDIVPRRLPEVVRTGSHGAKFDWSVGPDLVTQVAGDTPVIRPEFRAGDALIFDELNLHQTGVSDGMTSDRYAIESWFFAPSTYPSSGVPLVF